MAYVWRIHVHMELTTATIHERLNVLMRRFQAMHTHSTAPTSELVVGAVASICETTTTRTKHTSKINEYPRTAMLHVKISLPVPLSWQKCDKNHARCFLLYIQIASRSQGNQHAPSHRASFEMRVRQYYLPTPRKL